MVEQAERAKPLYLWGWGEVPPRLATFLDPSITEVKYHKVCLLFWSLNSITEVQYHHKEWLLFWTLVVTPYEIVTRGVICPRVESGFARFARSTTKKII